MTTIHPGPAPAVFAARPRAALLAGVLLATLLPACATGHPPRDARAMASMFDDASAHDAGLTVGILIVDGVYNTELTAPMDMFHHTVFHTEPGMRVFTVGRDRSPIWTFEGLSIVPHFGFDDAPPIDVLVVPSAEHSMDSDLQDARLMAWVAETGAHADWVLSLCDGAFVLAAAGLLDGRRSTTFPSDIPRYREMFPELDVVEGVSFVHDGKAITSAGGAKSFDPALYLIELLYGGPAAAGVAGGLVIDWDADAIEHVVVAH